MNEFIEQLARESRAEGKRSKYYFHRGYEKTERLSKVIDKEEVKSEIQRFLNLPVEMEELKQRKHLIRRQFYSKSFTDKTEFGELEIYKAHTVIENDVSDMLDTLDIIDRRIQRKKMIYKRVREELGDKGIEDLRNRYSREVPVVCLEEDQEVFKKIIEMKRSVYFSKFR